ncbi:TPA: hypothetical protein QB401_002196 [Pasteurella multocida]|uniref:hypothetical protein n=1 Tax=Pasteurella multocida TaxID=747 RepID=UPI002B489D38|nr:hypothetical protein [Pasteurella multocida]MEB3467505.1 hypothetical protein [Pasteurella multocida]WRK06672.1 hypothetical protein RFF38_08450 [Pasteurella multocida]HDR1354628.1 hypothetical protein [Pasteurella multocida]
MTKIEKGNLLEMTSRVSTAEISSSSPLSDVNDKSLLQILQQQNAELDQIHSQIKRFGGKEFNDLIARVLYWNKEKGAKFLDNLTLQLRSPLSENSSIARNIKTENDLSQSIQPAPSIHHWWM